LTGIRDLVRDAQARALVVVRRRTGSHGVVAAGPALRSLDVHVENDVRAEMRDAAGTLARELARDDEVVPRSGNPLRERVDRRNEHHDLVTRD
jgi:hypothetical protein